MKKTLNKVLAVLLSAVLFMSCAGAASAASISDLLMVIKLGKSQTDLVKNVVKTPVDIGISGLKTLKAIVDYKKADGDIVKSGVKTAYNGSKIPFSAFNLGKEVTKDVPSNASSSVKFVIAAAQFPPALLKDVPSALKFGSALAKGTFDNVKADISIAKNGTDLFKDTTSALAPSLGDIIGGIKLVKNVSDASANIKEIKASKDAEEEEQDTPLVLQEIPVASEEENADDENSEDSSALAAVENAATQSAVANTDGID